MTATASAAVHTYGWDTVFAVPVPEVNKAIVDHRSTPAGFAVTDTGYTLSGAFGDWRIGPGGDGRTVRLTWPVRDVVLTYTGTGKRYTFAGTVVVEVELHYVPHTGAQALMVRPTGPSPATPPISVVDISLTPAPSTISTAIIRAGLLRWSTERLAEFAHVFAVVDLNTKVDSGQWAFVAPHYIDYAYLDRRAAADGMLAVLCTTGSRTGERLPEQVSGAAIPPGSVAGFVISQVRLLDDLVRPAVLLAYPGLTHTDFRLNSDRSELYLVAGASVPLAPVRHNGSTYHPTLTNLTVRPEGDTIVLTSNTSTEVAVGITATCASTHWYTITLGESTGKQTLSFTPTKPPSIVHEIHQSPGSVLTELIITIVASIALAILAVLTDGTALVVGGLVVGLVLGLTQLTPALIERLNGADAPTVDLLLTNAVAPIVWTASSVFRLDQVGLNTSLCLGGNPLFV